MAREHSWTSISMYATVREKVDALREKQSYDELFLEICEQYDPDQADNYEYEPTESERENSEWETISLHQETYDKIDTLKQEGETFNDLLVKMVRQYENPKSAT